MKRFLPYHPLTVTSNATEQFNKLIVELKILLAARTELETL
jgi:hypothetical protein